MKNKYEWKIDSFAKDVDPDLAVKELERIENVYGALTPENILEGSKNEEAYLHKLFNWDDQKAANLYRLQQARQILNNIEITIVSDGEPRQMPLYETIVKDNTRVYKSIQEFTGPDAEQVRQQTIREINALKNKLSFFSQFSKASKKLGEAVTLLN